MLALELDPVHTQKLNCLVTDLDAEIFQVEDSLGWTYQFWRAAEKDAVNRSGVKIGADELPAVTQLFTEPYMVRFLLHNTLGAWWAGKVLAADSNLAKTAADEDALRSACALPSYSFDMLRFVRESDSDSWRSAAGTFPGWPKHANAITMLDPCCGSGHFLTEALAILAALRQVEASLSPGDAVAAVLRDNLHGLEIDGRCVQIAAFAVALTAWRIGGWQALPLPHIAWVGAPPPLPKREFMALAEGDAELEYALAALHDLFAQAPILGSLLEPSGGDLFEAAKMREIERLLDPLLAMARKAEPERTEGVIAARGMADAAELLVQKYTLQATNVPFLSATKQGAALQEYAQRRFKAGKADLATTMLLRMLNLAGRNGTVAVVTSQNWYSLGAYKQVRSNLLSVRTVHLVCDLGPAAFQDMNWWAARTALTIASAARATSATKICAFDAEAGREVEVKMASLLHLVPSVSTHADQELNPDLRFSLGGAIQGKLLRDYATAYQGVITADYESSGGHSWK